MDDCLRVCNGESDGGEEEGGTDSMVDDLGVCGDDEGVVNAVEVDRKELLLPNENQEPERVTVEAEEDVSNDVLETDSIVEDRASLTAAGCFGFTKSRTGSGRVS